MIELAVLAAVLDQDPGALRLTAMAGGCINQAARLDTPGNRYFVKWNQRPLAGQFAAEAAGLAALSAADTGLRVPAVVAWQDHRQGTAFLLLEYLESGARGPDFDERLGRGLAALHRHSSRQGFGFAADGYCGATPQPNGWMSAWADFYRERRLGHMLALLRERDPHCALAAQLEGLLPRLPALLGDPEPPALIHGDLWSGNLLSTVDGPGLIDPAAYFGHREAELGMMVLFGGFSERVFAAYDEAWPLQPGWRERLPLYTLYHLLNHQLLFGGAYGEQARALMLRAC